MKFWTELARPFFLKQLAMQEAQKEQAAKDGKPYYDNDLVVAKPDGAPISASWVSSQFGKLLEDLEMPHIRFHDLRHTAATNMHQLTATSTQWAKSWDIRLRVSAFRLGYP